MFDFVFWVLVIWFIINVIWMWFVLNKQSYQKSFAWINVAAVIIGFWVYYGTGAHSGGLADCFLWLNWLNVVLSIVIMKRKTDLPFHFSLKDIRFNSQIGRILWVGTPLAFQEFLTQVSFLFLCACVNRLSLTASAGYGVASKIVSFVMLIPSSVAHDNSS